MDAHDLAASGVEEDASSTSMMAKQRPTDLRWVAGMAFASLALCAVWAWGGMVMLGYVIQAILMGGVFYGGYGVYRWWQEDRAGWAMRRTFANRHTTGPRGGAL